MIYWYLTGMNLLIAYLRYKVYFAVNLLLMKKVFTLLAIVCSMAVAHAQTTPSAIDVNKLTNSIMGKLNPSLDLTKEQVPKTTEAISTFLTDKSKILSLQHTNNPAYVQKQGGLFNELKTKLTGILLNGQLHTFLELKPAANDPSNVLSNIFF